MKTTANKVVPAPGELVEGEDYYWEGQSVVFTERYHLKRGYCCESGCRHCPFGKAGADSLRDSKPE